MDFTRVVLDIVQNNVPVGPMNHTFITLVPKKKDHVTPMDFRPIALYMQCHLQDCS